MTLDQFWNIVDDTHRNSRGDMDKKCELLEAELRRLPLTEVRSFHAHFDECIDLGYSWELWAAAFIIGGGCSDDAFSDFRSTLVSQGRQAFERSVADPQYLANLDYDSHIAFYEGYQYVPGKVETDLGAGQRFPRSRPHPVEPSGVPWDEDQIAFLYPKLAEKYDSAG